MWHPAPADTRPDFEDELQVDKDTPKDERLTRLEQIARVSADIFRNQWWNEEDKSWWWERYPEKRSIVCAACLYKDILVVGVRHYSTTMQNQILALGGYDLLREYAGVQYIQGFVDQFGIFYTREEAAVIAWEAKQTSRKLDGLTSEDLY